jgi:hypothetical protein
MMDAGQQSNLCCPVSFLGLHLPLLYGKIHRMSPQRWVFFFFSILAGFVLGLLYGWVISPVEYVDTSPDSLRADYRADYALMVAEIYQAEQDSALAARRLSLLGSALSPHEIVAEALQFAQANQYASQDILLLQNLIVALQIYDTSGIVP